MDTKTIFITAGESSVAKNIFWTSVLPTILESSVPPKVVLIVAKDQWGYYQSKFAGPNVVVKMINPVKVNLVEKVIAFLARNGFYSGTNILMQNRGYLSKESFIPPWVKLVLGKLFGQSRLFRRVIRWLDLKCIKSPSDVIELFDLYEPDLVYSTISINVDVDIPIMREAKRRGVKTVGQVRSWDNLTSYGFLRFIPDLFLAQDNFLKNKAIAFHDVDVNAIRVTGFPYYDLFLDQNFLESRSDFCQRMDLDFNKKIVLYGAVGDFLFPHEGELAQVFEALADQAKINQPTQFIFRAHPAFASPLDKMINLKHVRPDRGATYPNDSLADSYMEKKDTKHLINSIYHADVVVTAGSTLMIDGLIFDKPIVTIGFDGLNRVLGWFSVERFYDYVTHIKEALKFGGIKLVKNPDDLALAINNYLEHPEQEKIERQLLIDEFIAPLDGQSGRRVANILLEQLP